MSGKANSKRWDDSMRFAVYKAIHDVTNPTLSTEQKDEVVDLVRQQGHDLTWEGISAAKTKRWDEVQELSLFKAIYTVTDPELSKEDKEEVAAIMRSEGYNVVWNGIRQHLQKLKKKEGGSAPATPAGRKTPATPASRKSTGAKRGRPSKASKEAAVASSLDAQDDESDEDMPTPTKKVKTEFKVLPKKEEQDDDDDSNVGGAILA